MAKVGFIGLGIMGAPMAQRLQEGGHELYVYVRKKLPENLDQAKTTVCKSGTEVAKQADIIITMVPDTPDVEEVLFGENGVAQGLSKGKIVVDMSSISPMAKNITLVGGNGDGQTTKVANQIIVALNIQAVAEALLFSSKAGADPAKVRQAPMGGFASSRILEVHGERMLKRTFNPGFRIELHQKDLNLALQGAKEMGMSLPNTATVQQLMSACAAHDMKALDHSALCQAIELMANHKIAE
jgi:2-hydroxy-3-oxopropionate reductase